jgi:hypothetical protein
MRTVNAPSGAKIDEGVVMVPFFCDVCHVRSLCAVAVEPRGYYFNSYRW